MLSAGYVYADFDDHNALGQIGYTSYGNGTSTEYTYYPGNNRIMDLVTHDINDDNIQSIHYTFDDVGNITAMQANTLTNASYTVNYSFSYDEVDRLTTATANCSNDPNRVYNQGYTYDLAGNMTEKTGIGGWEVLSWEDQNKHVRPVSVRFDAEVAGVAQRNIQYNQDQKPTQITYNGGTTYLTYDGAGERIKKVKGGETVIYVGGIYEIRDGQAMSHIFVNGQKIVTLAGSKEYYSHSDHLGSTSVVTDETGTIVEEIGYLPFGATLFRNEYNGSTWESAYRFTGQEFDDEYHLYNYNARLYDPIMSRFITPDTIIPQPYNPQSLNRYSYCLNNPLIYVDPSGHQETEYELDEIVVTASRLIWVDFLGFYGWVTVDEYFSFMSLYSTGETIPQTGYEYLLSQSGSYSGGRGCGKPRYPKNEVPSEVSKLEGRDKQLLDLKTLRRFREIYNDAIQGNRHEEGFAIVNGIVEPGKKVPSTHEIKLSENLNVELSVHVHPFLKGPTGDYDPNGCPEYAFPYAASGKKGYDRWIFHSKGSGDKGYAWRHQNAYHYIIMPDSTVVRYDYRGINTNLGKIMHLIHEQGG